MKCPTCGELWFDSDEEYSLENCERCVDEGAMSRRRFSMKQTDDGWIVFFDGKREVMRVQLPEGGVTQAELEAFKRHLLAHLHGAN